MQRTKYHVVPRPNWYIYNTIPASKNWDDYGGGSEKLMSQRNRKFAVREYLLEMLEKLHPWIFLSTATEALKKNVTNRHATMKEGQLTGQL